MAIDSHMHINSLVTADRDQRINKINENSSLEAVINVGLNQKTSEESLLIAKSNSKFYASVGVHPLYIESENLDFLYDLASHDKVVAIGEIGLDTLKPNIEEQKRYLVAQILIANELHLPVIIHSNNSNYAVIDIFEKYAKPMYGCVFHCFQPDSEVLKYLVANGYYVSYAGRLTYKTARKSHIVARQTPDNLFLVKTDSPYISPEPFRETINESANLKYITEKLAEVRGLSYEETESLSTRNAKRLFKKLR